MSESIGTSRRHFIQTGIAARAPAASARPSRALKRREPAQIASPTTLNLRVERP